MPSFDVEFVLDVPAHQLWAAMKDGNKIFPKINPRIFGSIDVVEGTEGAAGSVRLIKFGSAVPEGEYVKEKVVSLDIENMIVVTHEIEGGHLNMGLSKWDCTMKITAEGGKAKMHFTFNYEGEGPMVDVAIEQTKQATKPTFEGFAKHVVESGLYA